MHIKLCSLLIGMLLIGTAAFAQLNNPNKLLEMTLNLLAGGGNVSGSGFGPRVTSHVVYFDRDSIDNNNFVLQSQGTNPVIPPLTATIRFENQQYTGLTYGIGTINGFGTTNAIANGLSFGAGPSIAIGSAPGNPPIQQASGLNSYDIVGAFSGGGGPRNGMFQSQCQKAPIANYPGVSGTGIDAEYLLPGCCANDGNGAVQAFTCAQRMFDLNNPAGTSNRYYYGDLVIEFNYIVDSALIHLAGLGGSYRYFISGGSGSNLADWRSTFFSTELELVCPGGATLTKMSGNQFLTVSGLNILNNAVKPNTESVDIGVVPLPNWNNFGAATGTVRVTGAPTNVLRFKVWLRGSDANNVSPSGFKWSAPGSASGGSRDPLTGDTWIISVSQKSKLISNNVVTGGQVTVSQTICSNGDPAAFTQTVASTGSGTLTYQWQSCTGSCVSFTDIAGATGISYDPPAGLLVTTTYRRVTTSTFNPCGISSTNTANSNLVTVTVNNVTGGTITADQSICLDGGDPAAFAQSAASTGSGPLTYQWQSSTTSCAAGFSNIAGATASTHDAPAGLQVTTFFRRVTTSTLSAVPCTANSNCVTVMVNAVPAGTAGGPAVTQTLNVIPSSVTFMQTGTCNIIARLLPSGTSPVSGNVTAKVWVNSSIPLYGSVPYLARHFEIQPAANSSTATGTVTLFFLQAEFDAFNANTASVLDLPTGANDAVGKANLRINKYPGTSNDGSGLPYTYNDTASLIDPADANIVWNAVYNYWEVTFDVSGFSGFTVGTSNTLNICPNGSYKIPSGLTGSTYQWQLDNGTGYVNISNGLFYSGTSTAALKLMALPTNFYGYKYRCLVNAVPSTVYDVKFVVTWQGNNNTSWSLGGNWASCGIVPDQYTDVVIPTGRTNYPVVSVTTSIRSLRNENGSAVTVQPGINLNIIGQ
jgi:hypothetical protein